MRIRLILALTSSLVTTLCLPAAAKDTAVSLLPMSGPIQAKVMQIGMPLEAQKTAEKLRTALASQPEWAKTFLAKATPGKPLQYHPNFRRAKGARVELN